MLGHSNAKDCIYTNHFGIFSDLYCLNVIIVSSTNIDGPPNDSCQEIYLFNTLPRNKKPVRYLQVASLKI